MNNIYSHSQFALFFSDRKGIDDSGHSHDLFLYFPTRRAPHPTPHLEWEGALALVCCAPTSVPKEVACSSVSASFSPDSAKHEQSPRKFLFPGPSIGERVISIFGFPCGSVVHYHTTQKIAANATEGGSIDGSSSVSEVIPQIKARKYQLVAPKGGAFKSSAWSSLP
jgi:hypothetical protein